MWPRPWPWPRRLDLSLGLVVLASTSASEIRPRHWRLASYNITVVNTGQHVIYHWGTGFRGLMRDMATLPQGNQEPLVLKDKVGRLPGEHGVSKSMECDIFPSVLWHCWLSDRKGIQPVKSLMLVCWWWWFDWSFARLIAPVVTTTSIILCFNKHRLTQVHLENGH